MNARCQLRLSPDCKGEADVAMRSAVFNAVSCIACGKDFQKRYPHKMDGLSLIPLEQ